MSLRDKTITGVFWSFIQQGGAQGIQFVVIIVLARVLTPEDFGLIAMLAIFLELSQILITTGFGEALIQKKNTDADDFSAIFYINLVASLTLYIILFFSAPLIADFYAQPALINLTRVLTLVLIINAFSFVQEKRLVKMMKFKVLAKIHIPAIVISAIISVVLAYIGYGVWSLVALKLVYRFVFAVIIWSYSKWRPLFSFHKEKAKELFSFGSKLILSSLFNAVFRNAYLVVIGKFFPVNMLGYYKNAWDLERKPSMLVFGVINSVTFSAFSTIQDNTNKLKENYKKTIQLLFFFLCPVFIFAGTLAEPLFSVLLTNKWLPAVPFFQILCLAGIFEPITSFNLSILNVKGRSDIYLKLTVLNKVVIAVGILLAIPYGIWALVTFQSLRFVIAYFVNGYFSGRLIEYPLKEQVKDVLPVLIISAFVGVGVLYVDQSLNNLSDIVRLLVGFCVGTTAYFSVMIIAQYNIYENFISTIENLIRTNLGWLK